MVTIKNIAERYDLEWDGVYDDIEFFRKYAKQYPGPVLELAAGTGRVSIELAKDGHEVWAVDNDPRMLNIFKSKIRSTHTNNRIHLIKGDMEDVTLGSFYGLIILPGNSFVTLLSQESQIKTLLNIRDHLKDDGVAIIPIISWSEELSNIGKSIECCEFTDPEYDSIYHKKTNVEMDFNTQILIYHYQYKVEDNQSNIYETDTTVSTRMVFRYEMKLLVERSDMIIDGIYGNYDESALGNGNPWTIYIIRKKV